MSESNSDIVGFAGAGGNMGRPMSANLAQFLKSQAGTPVPEGSKALEPVLRIWNRDLSKVLSLEAEHGCMIVRSLEELATGCTIIHTCLSDDHALISVITTLLRVGSPGRVFVDHSTVLPETTAGLTEAAEAAGCIYIAAPVFGRPDAAVDARLLMVVAGPAEASARLAPQHAALTRRVITLGEHPPAANAMKLCGNFCIVSAIEMLSQGMTLAEKSGVPRHAFMDVMSDYFATPSWLGYGHRAAADDFDAGAGFTVELGLKDVSHMRSLAHRTNTPLPLADMAFSHLLHARAVGHGSSDWGAIALAIRQAAGLPIPPPPQRESL